MIAGDNGLNTDGNERPHNCKVRYVDDDKECSTCHKSISEGYFLERGNGSDTICVDCLMVAINENRLVIVDPTRETGLHCHKCKVRFTWADSLVQRGTTGAVYCIKCGLGRKKRRKA